MLFTSNKRLTVTQAKTDELKHFGRLNATAVLSELNSNLMGLSGSEVTARQEKYGLNQVAVSNQKSSGRILLQSFLDPFVLVLVALVVVSLLTSDFDGAAVMGLMILLSVLLRFIQEIKSQKASLSLKQMIENTCAVTRNQVTTEKPMREVVPGDLIQLRTGDLIPADAYLLDTKDLFLNQSSITGESMPVEKVAGADTPDNQSSVFNHRNLVFMGTDVISGQGRAVILKTGSQTIFGDLARLATQRRGDTQFDRGLKKISKLLMVLMVMLVPAVFVINVLTKGNWSQAFFFAIAVAVGLTPEMLPMIVNTNLAKGATTLAKKNVIVKELRSVQNLGAVDVLCTDKTGTLTKDKITLMKHLNPQGETDAEVLQLTFMNSNYQTGWPNLMDQAVINYQQDPNNKATMLTMPQNLQKVDEIPFDFNRRRLTVVVRNQQHQWMVTKGAFDEILSICDRVRWDGRVQPLTASIAQNISSLNQSLNEDGMRVIGTAYRMDVHERATYEIADEKGMVLGGLMGFLDPEKPDAKEAIGLLQGHGVTVKILTGDNGAVTQHVANKVGIQDESYIDGQVVDELDDNQLASLVAEHDLFVKLNPLQKSRIITVLQQKHTVAFMGDGINDAPALRQADVGISVENAADVTKEASSVILVEKSLLVLEDGIVEGRKVYRNTMKYIRMTMASNFGNALSILLASIVLPFLPMLSLQILVQNLIYDLAQIALPWDRVDADTLVKPTPWQTEGLLKFAFIFGPVSSIFDLLTFSFMWFVIQANTMAMAPVFQTGWFLVGLITQSLVIFVYRTNRVPFIKSKSSWPVVMAAVGAILMGIFIAVGPIQAAFNFRGLPAKYWLFLPIVVVSYLAISDLLKKVLHVKLD